MPCMLNRIGKVYIKVTEISSKNACFNFSITITIIETVKL